MAGRLLLGVSLTVPLGAEAFAGGPVLTFDGNPGSAAAAMPALRFTPHAPAAAPRPAPAVSPARGGRCGVERWAVKTLSDPDAGAVSLQPVDTTVSELAQSPAGSPWSVGGSGYKSPPDRRILSGPYAETQVYRVRATLTAYKLEGDSDIHLVMQDPQSGATLDAESVDPTCPGADVSAQSSAYAGVRQQLSAILQAQPPSGQMTSASIPVTLTGVRFFDPPHGQVGHADNGSELHPVLCVSTGGDCG